MGIKVLVASRDRPEKALATYESFHRTVTLDDTEIFFGLDYDEPRLHAYEALLPYNALVVAPPEHSGSLTKVTNYMTVIAASIYGSAGDDHRFETVGWDAKVTEALGKPGVAYGDDKFQGENLPTAAFVSAEIVATLGWFALPVCDHMYIDDAWKAIGQGIDSLHYLPDVIIEHLHFAANKGTMDESYKKTNSPSQVEKDKLAYRGWVYGSKTADIAKLRGALDVRTGSTPTL